MITCENHPTNPAIFKISLRDVVIHIPRKPHHFCGDCAIEFVRKNLPRSHKERSAQTVKSEPT